MTDFQQIQRLDVSSREDAQRYSIKREAFDAIRAESGRHFIGIVGPRGAGKTVLLKQLALDIRDSLYISADTLNPDDDLYTVVSACIERMKVSVLLIDEIHFCQGFEQSLKKLYDFVPVRIIFTSSVALSLVASAYDLSRRVRLTTLYPFSFREFVQHKTSAVLPKLSFDDIFEKRWTSDHLRYEYLFDEYLRGGIMPFALDEPQPIPLLENIVATIIEKDMPRVARLHIDELAALRKVLAFIARSTGDGINYSSLAVNCGITRYKAEAYVTLFEKAFVLNPIYPAGANVLREPKILMCLPIRLLYCEYEKAVGALREDFFAESLRMRGVEFLYLKSSRGAKTPDFLVKSKDGDIVIEIGGKSKGRTQFKGIAVEKQLILTHPGMIDQMRRPLFLAGYL